MCSSAGIAQEIRSLYRVETRAVATYRPGDADLKRLVSRKQGQLSGLVNALAAGRFPDARDFTDAVAEALRDGHLEALILGRMRAGVGGPATSVDLEAAIAVMDSESGYLLGLLEDLDGGRYLDDAGALRTAQVQRRVLSYLGRMRGSANEAWFGNGPAEATYTWRMTAVEHCADCPEIASYSPYRADELWTTPGSNDTECLFNCKCVLIRNDGMTGFSPYDWSVVDQPQFVI